MFKSNQRVLWHEITGNPEGNRIGTPGDLLYATDTGVLWIKAFGRGSRTGWMPLAFGNASGDGTPLVAATILTTAGIPAFVGTPQGIETVTIIGANGPVRLGLSEPRNGNQWTGIATARLDTSGVIEVGIATITPGAGATVDVAVADNDGAAIIFNNTDVTLAVILNDEGPPS